MSTVTVSSVSDLQAKKSRLGFLRNPYVTVLLVVLTIAAVVVLYMFVPQATLFLNILGAFVKENNIWALENIVYGPVTYALIVYPVVLIFVFFMGMALKQSFVDWRKGVARHERNDIISNERPL